MGQARKIDRGLALHYILHALAQHIGGVSHGDGSGRKTHFSS